MKRFIITIAAISLFLLPQLGMADSTTLYGKLRYSINSVDDPNFVAPATEGVEGLTAEDNTSVFGLKGKYGKDVKVFFHLQSGASSDKDSADKTFKQRFYYGGVEGKYGTVKYGLLTNAYKMPGFKLDPFYNTAHISASGAFSTGGATYGLSGATNGFTENSLEYTTPTINDSLTFNVGLHIDDSNADEHGHILGMKFKQDKIEAGAQMATNGSTVATLPGIAADGSALRIYATYKGKGCSAGVSYEQVDVTSTLDVGYLYITGSYQLKEKYEIATSLGIVDEGSAEGMGLTLGVYRNLLPSTKLFALTSFAKADATGVQDPSVISVGIQHNFGADL